MAEVSTDRVLALCGIDHKNPHDTAIDLAAAEAAKFLLFLIKERGEKSEPPDIKQINADLTDFIRKKNPGLSEGDVPSVLDATQKHIVCQTAGIEDESLRSFQIFASMQLLEDIKASYKPPLSLPTEETSGRTVSNNDFPVANGNRINRLAIDYWRNFPTLRLDSGAFTAGKTSTATVYTRAASGILSHETGPLSLNLDGALAAFSVLPPEKDHFGKRVIVAGLASANLFAGLGYDFFPSLGVRAGLQAAPAGYTGWNLPFNYLPPFTSGASLVWRPGDDVTLAAGSEVQFEPYTRNVQGFMDPNPNLIGLAPFAYVNSPHFFADASYMFYETGTEIQGEAGVPFSIGGQRFNASIQGNGTIEGIPVYPASLFLSLSYIPDIGEDQGMVASATIVTMKGGMNGSSPEIKAPNRAMENRLGEIAQRVEESDRALLAITKEQRIVCYEEEALDGNLHYTRYDCLSRSLPHANNSIGTCEYIGRTEDGDTILECNTVPEDEIDSDGVLEPDEAVNRRTTVVRTADDRPTPRTSYRSHIIEAELEIREPLIAAIHDSDSFADFAAQLKDGASSSAALVNYLHYISEKLYETYDYKGLNVSIGSGDVEDINLEEMYLAFKGRVFDPDGHENTSVCRGLALFPAAMARAWGWESLTASFKTGSSGHVVAIVKPPDFNNYQIIDGGTKYTGALTVLETLENLTAVFGTEDGYPLPPNFLYNLYDHTGKYIRTIFTNLGSELIQRTAAPDRLKGHLRGQKK